MSMRRFYIGLFLFFSMLCGSIANAIDENYKKTPQITKSAYADDASKKAVVLMAVNWGRQWGCGGYENAQLTGIGFDLITGSALPITTSPDLYLKSPSRVFVKPVFTNYAFLLPPGVYGISYMDIKVAKSRSEVGHLSSDRSILFKDNQPNSGTFEAKAGEIVYIGNFWLDCSYDPILWRYFSTMDTFPDHLKEYSKQYKFIPVEQVQYRLFSSNVFSNPSDNTYGQKTEHKNPESK